MAKGGPYLKMEGIVSVTTLVDRMQLLRSVGRSCEKRWSSLILQLARGNTGREKWAGACLVEVAFRTGGNAFLERNHTKYFKAVLDIIRSGKTSESLRAAMRAASAGIRASQNLPGNEMKMFQESIQGLPSLLLTITKQSKDVDRASLKLLTVAFRYFPSALRKSCGKVEAFCCRTAARDVELMCEAATCIGTLPFDSQSFRGLFERLEGTFREVMDTFPQVRRSSADSGDLPAAAAIAARDAETSCGEAA